MTPFSLDDYLARIGRTEIPRTADGLFALQEAQLRAIPFENIDPLLGQPPDLSLAAIARKSVFDGRGGYCLELNTLLAAALERLGFPVHRRLARVRMGAESGGARSHLTLTSEVGGTRFLVDAGFGGPGPLAPLVLDSDAPQAAPNGTYRLSTDPVSGERVLSRETSDGWFALYGLDDAWVGDTDLEAANHICCTWDGAPFHRHLMMSTHVGDTRLGLFNRALTVETPSGIHRHAIEDYEDFTETVTGRFNIRLDPARLRALWERLVA